MSKRKMAFEYGGPSKCEYCKHYNMFRGVCNKSSMLPVLPLTMDHECDVEEPEQKKCE